MNWAHLPVAGGIYDQNPKLIDQWTIIFNKQAEHERREMAKREREMSRRHR